MTLNQLLAFVEIARLRNFTAAAKAIGLTQPGVSDLIQKLEVELGAKLLARQSRSITLTPAGQELLPFAEHAISAVENGVAAVKSVESLKGGTASFGLMRNGPHYLGSNLAARFHQAYPNVRLRLLGQNSYESADDIRRGALEAGLLTLPVGNSDLTSLEVARDELFVVSRPEDQRTEPLSMRDFTSANVILYDAHYAGLDPARNQLEKRAHEENTSIRPTIEVEYAADALELVSAGFGITILCGAALDSLAKPRGLVAQHFSRPLYDVLALVKQTSNVTSVATRTIAQMAAATLTERAAELPTVELLEGVEPRTVASFLSA